MMQIKTITDQDIYGIAGLTEKKPRKAVRVILFDGDRIALLNVQKYRYYDLPGGGIEENERIEHAIVRETKEETGCDCEIIETLGCVEMNSKSLGAAQLDYCVIGELFGEIGEPSMTEEEIEEETALEWHALDEAIQLIGSQKVEGNLRFVQYRNLMALDMAKEAISKEALVWRNR